MSDTAALLPTAQAAASVLAAACPLLFLAAALVPSGTANRLGLRFARGVAGGALALFAMAAGVALTLWVWPQPAARHFVLGPVQVDLYLDSLSAIMLLLVTFLGAVVARYSCNYLAGDPGQGRFAKWLAVTIGSVLSLLVAGNLLLFTLGWVATSLSLHQLLTFYPGRPAGALAARKKFLFSRLGDACMVGTLYLTWQCFGSWQFGEIFARAEALRAVGGEPGSCLGGASLLLVIGALLKSAQFPFHSWLPDTMETPTPVSALMHAGIINAGGFLIVRLSPIVAASPAALDALALAGAVTALFASLVMLTQTSVKRSLAYSTIAQMGFMMLQCGLGAFALAILHIVAHSLYKAHAFLSSGSIISLSRSAWNPADRPAAHPLLMAVMLAAAAGLTWAVGGFFGLSLQKGAGVLLLGAVFIMGLASLLWNLWGRTQRWARVGWGVLICTGAALSYFGLHAGFEALLAGAVPHYEPERTLTEHAVMALVVVLFLAVMVFQSQLPSWSATRWGRALYVHVSQGFYLGTLANRLTRNLAPKAAR